MIRLIIILFVFTIVSCNKETDKRIQYKKDIGDTYFKKEIDNLAFKFCDSTTTFHSRSKVFYRGGNRALEKELINNYDYKEEYKSFSGYFFIRLAVNCKNEIGRFRWEIVDNNFEKTSCNSNLEQEIISLAKRLKGWEHVIYNDEDYDGYTFFIIKIKKGKIVKA